MGCAGQEEQPCTCIAPCLQVPVCAAWPAPHAHLSKVGLSGVVLEVEGDGQAPCWRQVTKQHVCHGFAALHGRGGGACRLWWVTCCGTHGITSTCTSTCTCARLPRHPGREDGSHPGAALEPLHIQRAAMHQHHSDGGAAALGHRLEGRQGAQMRSAAAGIIGGVVRGTGGCQRAAVPCRHARRAPCPLGFRSPAPTGPTWMRLSWRPGSPRSVRSHPSPSTAGDSSGRVPKRDTSCTPPHTAVVPTKKMQASERRQAATAASVSAPATGQAEARGLVGLAAKAATWHAEYRLHQPTCPHDLRAGEQLQLHAAAIKTPAGMQLAVVSPHSLSDGLIGCRHLPGGVSIVAAQQVLCSTAVISGGTAVIPGRRVGETSESKATIRSAGAEQHISGPGSPERLAIGPSTASRRSCPKRRGSSGVAASGAATCGAGGSFFRSTVEAAAALRASSKCAWLPTTLGGMRRYGLSSPGPSKWPSANLQTQGT